MSFVRTTQSMVQILDNPLTVNEQPVFTTLDEQTYQVNRSDANIQSSPVQSKFMKIVPHEVHIGCLRVLMNETVKVSKHYEIIGVINNEIARLRENSGTEIIPSYKKDEEVRRGNNIRVPDREVMFQVIEEYLMAKILNDSVFRTRTS